VHDVADLEQRGVPTVFVASEQFRSARDAQAAALGFDAGAVWVPHPIQDRTDEEMVAIADQVFDQVVAALLG
jgi:hypothetical protein